MSHESRGNSFFSGSHHSPAPSHRKFSGQSMISELNVDYEFGRMPSRLQGYGIGTPEDHYLRMENRAELENELVRIDPNYFKTGDSVDGVGSFFRLIDNQAEHDEQIHNRNLIEDKTLETEFKSCFEQSYTALVGSKIFEFVSHGELINRIENFLMMEIESPDRSESPLEKIKHEYFEMMFRLKNKINSKDKINQVLNPIAEYAIFVVRAILKSIKSFDAKKTMECRMKIASMDRKKTMLTEKLSMHQ